MDVLTFSSDVITVEVLPEVGGRIHRITAYGIDLLRTPPAVDTHRNDPFMWGSYPMVPWCNRIAAGKLHFDGVDVELPINLDGHAIHGLAFDAPWRVVTPNYLDFTHRGDAAYPWAFVAGQHFEVEDNRFSMTVALTNVGDADLPGGLGIHPWFTATEVSLHAETIVSLGDDRLPTGAPPRAVEGRFDLRAPGPIPWGVDDIWTGLTAHHVHLGWPEHGLRALFSFSDDVDHVVMAAREDFGAIAVEPQTMVTNQPARIGVNGGMAVTYSLEAERADR